MATESKELIQIERGGKPPLLDQIDLQNVKDANDLTIAELFVRFHGDDHRYVRDGEYWLCFTQGYWQADVKAHAVYISLKQLRADLIAIQKQFTNNLIEQILYKLSNARTLTSVIRTIATQDEISILSSDLDTKKHLIGCQNGIYNTSTNNFIRKAAQIRKLYITKRLAARYDPQAKCPQWEAFLKMIFLDNEELIRFVQKAMGLSLSGEVLEERLFFTYGSGANWKTTFFNTISEIFRKYHKEIDSMTLIKNRSGDHRLVMENLANLRGIRLATSNEIPEQSTYNDNIIKQLCSRDEISCKEIYHSVTSFVPSHKLWIRSNHKPVFNVRDGGMLRRICLIPFDTEIPPEERIERFEDRLLKETSGILNWLIQGWKAYQQEKLFPLPRVMELALREYVEECDILAQFIEENYIQEEGSNTILSSFTKDYNEWCSANGFRGSNAKNLADSLRKSQYNVSRGAKGVSLIRDLYKKTGLSFEAGPAQHPAQ